MAPNSMSDAGPSTSCNSVKTTTVTTTSTTTVVNGKGTNVKKLFLRVKLKFVVFKWTLSSII